jgi:hypothetical protein
LHRFLTLSRAAHPRPITVFRKNEPTNLVSQNPKIPKSPLFTRPKSPVNFSSNIYFQSLHSLTSKIHPPAVHPQVKLTLEAQLARLRA